MRYLVPALIFLTTILGAQDAVVASVTPPPGTYNAPLTIRAAAPEGAVVRYRFLEAPASAASPWTGAMILDALPGETRSYALRITTDLATGETVTRDYRYQVSRKAAVLPVVQPEPTRYTASVTVRADMPPGWVLQENGEATSLPRTIDAEMGRLARFVFTAKGPSGESLDWEYSIDRRDQESISLDVVSPTPGEWANSQNLVALFRGVDRVLWSYGEHLSSQPFEYKGPIALTSGGKQTITVAGHSRIDGRWLEKTVSWTNGSSTIASWPESGVKSTLELPTLDGALLSWDDGRSWRPSAASTEPASLNSRKILSLLLKTTAGLFRYVYWLDARAPQPAQVEFLGGWNPKLSFAGPSEAWYRVSWIKADGVVQEPGLLWGPVGAWKVPDGVQGAQVQLSGPNGIAGEATSIAFSETGWSTPSWVPLDQSSSLPPGGSVPLRPGFRPLYEVSDHPDVKEPGPESPLLEGPFVPLFPWGSDRTLYVRFAWRDAGGLVGPASEARAVRVDRVPPLPPEVTTLDGKVLVKPSEGEEDGAILLWAATPNRVTSPETLTFVPYSGTLDLSVLRSAAQWFHAEVQDRAGNTGQARLNVALSPSDESGLVQVDPNPAVGETAVQNGGVYPWSSFRLRALEQGLSLWVGVADVLPEDWKSRLQPWSGVFSRGIARGERRTFVVFWNAKTADGWAWEQPKAVTLTLDLSAPAPVLVTWPSQPLGEAWTLQVKPPRAGDQLKYSFTLDGSLPPDPRTSGDQWPGTKTWDAAGGSRINVRVRMAAVSVSGLSVEIPAGDVTIDRTPPVSVVPALDPFSYRLGPSTVALPFTEATVRYTLTTDGSLPAVPGQTSPVVSRSGLFLEGKASASVLYRFRWRSFSPSGAPGPATDAYGVLVDRTRAAPALDSGSSVPAPLLLGIPESGVSSAPVTVNLASPTLVRFEVREGLGDAPQVTAESSPWSGPLVLDGGPGIDRSYAISLRAFSPEGRALSQEMSYRVRVDRSPPSSPAFDLAPDARRPEASLRTSEKNPDETLFYRWSWDAFREGKGQSEWLPLSAPAVYSAPSGTLTRLKVEAYLRDEAGNVGATLEKVLLIDQNVVYVAPQSAGDGSRDKPLGSPVDAIERARREGKTLLFVAAGSYAVSKTLNLSGLEIVGGLGTDWESSVPTRSLFSAAPVFSGHTLLESAEKDWSLSGVDLASSNTALDSIVLVRGGNVVVKDSAWTWGGSAGWDQEDGTVDLTNVAITYDAKPAANLFRWKSLEAVTKALRLSASGNQDGVLFFIKDSQVLVQDLVMVSKSARGFDGIWQVEGSRLNVDQARIQAGDGAERATAFVLKNTQATFWNTEVSLYGQLANTGYQTSGGSIEVQKGTLSLLAGREFNQGFVLDHTETTLRTFDLKVESGAYQGGFAVDGGSLTVSTARIRLSGGGKLVWGGQFLSSPLVRLEDVAWVLSTKTPGELWKQDKPWALGSSAGSQKTW